ncbi:hypothetical protein DdX_16916 [Ditylenchus destructor]|uniref:Uncharacterized protein n=1 Tax=Ditylenchus destructor TaxID=166010 RepID=A0AAD4MM98_9BILA|nr:hypothetical protein DdX_16916 [Ditylenchus destructor]
MDSSMELRLFLAKLEETLSSVDVARTSYITFVQGFLGAWNAGLNLYVYLLRHDEIRSYAKRSMSDLCGYQSSCKLHIGAKIRVGDKVNLRHTLTPSRNSQ